MLSHGLARAEGPWNGGGAPLADGKEGVDDPLSGNQGPGDGQPPGNGPGVPDGAVRRQLQLSDVSLAVCHLHQHLVHIVISVGGGMGHCAGQPRGDQAAVDNGVRLPAVGVENAGLDLVALLHVHRDGPQLLQIQGGQINPPPQKGPGDFLQSLQRPTDAVEDVAQQSGTQPQGHGRSGGGHHLTRLQPGGVLIDLNGGHVSVHADYFTDELLTTHIDHVLHGQPPASGDLDHRAVHTINLILFHGPAASSQFSSKSSDNDRPKVSAKWPPSSSSSVSKEQSTRIPS